MTEGPKSEWARYAFGYSDKKPGRWFWIIHGLMIAYVVYSMIEFVEVIPQ